MAATWPRSGNHFRVIDAGQDNEKAGPQSRPGRAPSGGYVSGQMRNRFANVLPCQSWNVMTTLLPFGLLTLEGTVKSADQNPLLSVLVYQSRCFPLGKNMCTQIPCLTCLLPCT